MTGVQTCALSDLPVAEHSPTRKYEDLGVVPEWKINTCYTPKKLKVAMQGWGEDKKAAVRSMGLYGVLDIDTFPKKHKEQAMQLLMSVIPEQSCLSLDTVGQRTIDLNADVCCRILGTRKGGSNEIQVCSRPDNEKSRVVEDFSKLFECIINIGKGLEVVCQC